MWQKIKGLREERGQAVAEMKAILKKSEDEKRDLTAEDATKFAELEARADGKAKEIERYEKVGDLEKASETREIKPVFERRDLRQYSLLRAIRQQMQGRPVDGLEKEVSDEIAKRSGKEAQGFYFPIEIAVNPSGMEKRDLNLTTGAGAKPTVTDATQFIEFLRAKALITQLGARVLNGLTGDLSIPRQTAGATAYWVTEGNAPTESNQTVGQVSLAPKTVGAFTDISRKFILQSAISAEQFVREDLATTLAIELTRAALNGSGAGAEPTGILQNAGVATVAIAANGGAPTWAKMVELETSIANLNADVGNLGYVTTAKARGTLKTTEKAASTGQYIWAADNTLNGYRAFASTLVPSNLTKGTGTNLSAAIFGNFNDLVIGLWSGLDILVDPYTASTSGTVRVVALQDVDIKIRHDESFAKIVDIVTA